MSPTLDERICQHMCSSKENMLAAEASYRLFPKAVGKIIEAWAQNLADRLKKEEPCLQDWVMDGHKGDRLSKNDAYPFRFYRKGAPLAVSVTLDDPGYRNMWYVISGIDATPNQELHGKVRDFVITSYKKDEEKYTTWCPWAQEHPLPSSGCMSPDVLELLMDKENPLLLEELRRLALILNEFWEQPQNGDAKDCLQIKKF